RRSVAGEGDPEVVRENLDFHPFCERAGARAAARRRNWQTGGMNSLHSAPRPGALTDQEHQDEGDSPAMTDPVTAGAEAKPGPGEPCVLLKQGEIFLKGRNRQQFERMLHANVRGALRSTGMRAELTLREGVLVLRVARDGLTAAEHAAAVDKVAE